MRWRAPASKLNQLVHLILEERIEATVLLISPGIKSRILRLKACCFCREFGDRVRNILKKVNAKTS
jgi:hypothetical protein